MSQESTGAAASTGTNTPEQSAETVLASIPGDKGKEATASSKSSEAVDASEASDSELEEVIDSEEATEEEVQEAKIELKRRMKFKVNGREVEKEIDFSDENALQELLQKGFAADERFQSASSLEKKMKEFAQLMQSDPIQALIAAGHDPDKLTQAYMEKRVEELSKSPEQLQLEKLQKEIEKERKLRENLENEKLTAEQARVEAEYSRQLDDEITSALSSSDLPKSPYVVKRIAENLMLGIEQGNEDITVQDVLPVVERQIKDEIRQMFEAMPEDIIEKTLGTDISTKLRKRRLSSMKKAPETASSVKATGQSEINKSKPKEEPKPVKAKDFFKGF
jgi:hypothetical protein